MNILLAHHLEPIWEQGLKRFGTNLESLCQSIAEYIENNNIHKIIITQFERDKYSQVHEAYYSLFELLDSYGIELEWKEYGYGWNRECFNSEDEGIHFCEGGNHSEVVLIEDWIRNLKNHTVLLCGAFVGECLEDIQIAMEICNVPYKNLKELQVG